MMSEESKECITALIPLQMWLRRECGNALREIRIMQDRVYALLDCNARICKTQIKLQKKQKALEKRVKVLEGRG